MGCSASTCGEINIINCENLYCITSIFNPTGNKKRVELYSQFKKHIEASGLKLVTIECAFGDGEYQCTDMKDGFNIQVRAAQPLWIKENLINLAIKKLPEDWKYVLWLDSDVEFEGDNWKNEIVKALSKYDIIQVFKYANFLGPESQILERNFSLMYSYIHNLPIDRKFYNEFLPHTGYGWGMTRKMYDITGGLLDRAIVGSGDSYMGFALLGRVDHAIAYSSQEYHPNYIKMLHEYEKKIHISSNWKLGYANLIIKHHFHGYKEDRHYVDRMKLLTEHQYDPYSDVCVNEYGVIQLKSKKKELCNAIFDYFNKRKEDGNKDLERKYTESKPLDPEEILIRARTLNKSGC